MAKGAFYVDQALTNVSQAWRNESSDFIAEQIFPVLEVPKKTGKYWAYTKDNLRVPSSTVRTGRSKTKEATYGKDLSDFGPLSEHALKDFVTKDEYDQTDSPLSVDSDTVDFLSEQMAIAEEQDLATMLADTAIITNNVDLSSTPASQWSDYANSDPFVTITTAVLAARLRMVKVPNTITFSFEVWMALISHPAMLARMPGANVAVVTEALLLAVLAPYGITKILIGKVVKNNVAEGQTDSLSTVWGKHCWLAYVTASPSLRAVNGGYTLRLKGGKYVDRKDEFDPKGSWIRNNDYFDQMLFSADCFYLIKNVIA